jgi:hypothetical protein
MFNPNGLQHIGAAAFAADAAPAVLADFGTGSGGHEHGAGRDVEGVRTVTLRCPRCPPNAPCQPLRTLVANSRITCAAAVISPMVSFLTRRPGHQRRQSEPATPHPLMIMAHEVQHLVMKNLTVLDGALQRFLRCDGDGF